MILTTGPVIVEEYDERNEFTGDAYVSAYYHLVGGPEPSKHLYTEHVSGPGMKNTIGIRTA